MKEERRPVRYEVRRDEHSAILVAVADPELRLEYIVAIADHRSEIPPLLDWLASVANEVLGHAPPRKLYELIFDDIVDYVEALSFPDAIATWRASKREEWGSDWSPGDEPESCRLVHDSAALRGSAVLWPWPPAQEAGK